MYGVGIMSGTSLDGIDTVLVDIHGSGTQTQLKVIGYNEYPLKETIVSKIKQACSLTNSNSEFICSLNFELGKEFSIAVQELLKKLDFPKEKLDFIASHGQTIYHIPFSKNHLFPSTVQIGEAAVIAYDLNTPVISNFRVMDMAAGGQGAPLVPYSEYVLFSEKNKNIALQNIGGIGNVTVLNGSLDINEIQAFDTGPGNMMINEACHILYNTPFDANGKIARSGNIDKELLYELLSHPYFKKFPPKSTGREDFGEHYVKSILDKYSYIRPQDVVATFTMFTAKSIAFHYKRDIHLTLDKMIIGGGGAHNQTLVKMIKDELSPIPVYTQDELGYSSDAKEAIAFAILGNETLNNHFSNVKSATGALQNVILGQITPCPVKK